MVDALLQPDRGQPARTIHILSPEDYDGWLGAQPPRTRLALAAQRFTGKPGSHAVFVDEEVQAVTVAARPGPCLRFSAGRPMRPPLFLHLPAPAAVRFSLCPLCPRGQARPSKEAPHAVREE